MWLLIAGCRWKKNKSFKCACVSNSYSTVTAQRTGGLPLTHLFVFLLHFTLTWTAGMGLWHCVCTMYVCVCVCLYKGWLVYVSPSLAESNLPGWAHKSRWGMEMGMKTVVCVCVCDSFTKLIPVVSGAVGGGARISSDVVFALLDVNIVSGSLSMMWLICLIPSCMASHFLLTVGLDHRAPRWKWIAI